jgi:predicted small lipoprotein YifL
MRLRQLVVFLVLCGLLAACGNKGPLVRPDQTSSAQSAPTPDSGRQ